MTDEQRKNGQGLKRRNQGLINVLSQLLLGGKEKTIKKKSQNIRRFDRISNPKPPVYIFVSIVLYEMVFP
jgi:hypothetical protein